MHRWMLAILFGLVLTGCGLKADEPSIVLLDEPLTTVCSRSMGGRFVYLGNDDFFDMQKRALVKHTVPFPPGQYGGIWLADEIMLYSPWSSSTTRTTENNPYEINPGGFLLDAATGVVTDIATLPKATRDQLLIDGSAAYQRDRTRYERSPDGQYRAFSKSIYRLDPITHYHVDKVVESTINEVTACERPWEPDSSGIIFLDTPLRFKSADPGRLRFLPLP